MERWKSDGWTRDGRYNPTEDWGWNAPMGDRDEWRDEGLSEDLTDYERVIRRGWDEDADIEPAGAAFMRGYLAA